MNFSNLTDRALATELVKRSKTNSSELNKGDKKSINEMIWAMDSSPKIRDCLEQLCKCASRISLEQEFNKAIANAVEMNALVSQYNGFYIEKRLQRIEKHFGIEINFEE